MNKSAIKEMFAGKRGTYDSVPLSAEFKEAQSKSGKAIDGFLEKLTPEQQKLFHETYEHMSNETAAYAEDHFVEGFKFGLLVGAEVGNGEVKD